MKGVVTAVLIAGLGGACTPTPPPDPPAEIAGGVVSLVPSVHEWMLELGLRDRIVARTEWDDDPRLAHLPSVGGEMTPSLEVLRRLHPGAVLGGRLGVPAAAAARMRTIGLDVRLVPMQTLADAFALVDSLGRWFGVEAAARDLAQRVRRDIQTTRARWAGRAPRRVMFVVWQDPPLTAATGTFIDELIQASGGVNVYGDLSGWPQVGIETVVARDPEVILWPTGEAGAATLTAVRGLPGWREVPAVREGRVAFVPARLLNRPGPHLATAVRRLGEALHPAAVTEAS